MLYLALLSYWLLVSEPLTAITNSLKSIGGIVESLHKVRAQVEKEQQQSAKLRGQRLKGNREDPTKK